MDFPQTSNINARTRVVLTKVGADVLNDYFRQYHLGITEQTKQWEALCKKYCCYTCKYYESCNTSIGLIEKCNYKKENISNRRDFSSWKLRRESFSPKKSCVNYERK